MTCRFRAKQTLASGLPGRVYEFTPSSNTARRKFAVALRLDRRDVSRLCRCVPFRSPATCVSGRADTLGFDRRHASGDSDAVLALARSETFPRLSNFALLLLPGRARIEIGDALLLRPLRGGTPVVVLCPVSAEASIIYAGTAAANAAAIGGRRGGQVSRPLVQSSKMHLSQQTRPLAVETVQIARDKFGVAHTWTPAGRRRCNALIRRL